MWTITFGLCGRSRACSTEQVKGRSSLGRAVNSTLARVLGLAASGIAIFTLLFSKSVRHSLGRAWQYVYEMHPQGAIQVLLLAIGLLVIALILVTMKMRNLRERAEAAERTVASQNQRLDERRTSADRALFAELISELPSASGVIEHLRHGSIGSFPKDILHALRNFELAWNNAEHEFMDPELERRRIRLLGAVSAFTSTAGKWTFPLGGDLQGVPPEWKVPGKDEEYYRAVQELEDAADEVIVAHQDLIRQGRESLGRAS